MGNSNNYLEALLCSLHRKNYCVLVGNGTTALYLSIKCYELNRKNVGFQDNICPNVLLAVLLAGANPILLQVKDSGLGINMEKIDIKLDCIISIHPFGIPCNIKEIESYCNNNNVVHIEDAATGQGGSIDTKPIGSFGDLSILSFGTGKTVDIGHGGAILTNSNHIYKKILLLKEKLPRFNKINYHNTFRFNYFHTRYYNEYFLQHEYSKLKKKFKKLIDKYAYYFIYSFDESYREKLVPKINNIEYIINIRRNNHKFLENYFSDNNFNFLHRSDETVPWRFNLLINNRDQILKSLLNENIKISSWYPSLGFFFDFNVINKNKKFIDNDLSKKILNIWINEEIDKQYLSNTSRRIIQLYDDINSIAKYN